MKRGKRIRFLAYFLEILLFFILQQAPDLLPVIHYARPLLLIPTAVTIALFEPQVASTAFGLFCGLLIDAGTNGGVLGMHAIILTVICFVVSYLAHDLLQINALTAFLVCGIAAAITIILQWLLFYVSLGYADPAYALVEHYLSRFLYTIALGLPIYALNRTIALRI
ncbi:rod shape-determining protein MreD [Caproicibacterium lactatifermentans]|uniref:Rod shape-determining protein MreD n=1 Tax=Caproicibacterium lactatifermentans TaxID=2666138 RepID=A0A859DSG2_9FIRM|nr:rod shape-determining protein MreD [Caproicibacterium lactatifermentans]QKN23053.1 rod shape-determining protein MreD [Caproicibacterium lactatifermentans]